MVTKQKPLVKGGFCLFIVWFEIESNFENRLNLRGLKMKTVSINVYSYDELSSQAQNKAFYDWQGTDPAHDLFVDWVEFLEELEYQGVGFESWKFNYCTHNIQLDLSCDLFNYERGDLSILKKLHSIYYELAFSPKTYWLKGKTYISKIQMIQDCNWIMTEFVSGIKKFIKDAVQRKYGKRPLEFYIHAAIEQAAKVVQEEYDDILNSFPQIVRKKNYYFYADGRRFYAESKV